MISFKEENGDLNLTKLLIVCGSIMIIMIVITMAVMPVYKVWERELAGKAQLKEAEWNRQIAIKEAEAKKQSAEMLAEAEIIRAGGIAKANEIIAGSITEEYIKYKFIEGLNDGNTEVIYVPTESNLPILEARNK